MGNFEKGRVSIDGQVSVSPDVLSVSTLGGLISRLMGLCNHVHTRVYPKHCCVIWVACCIIKHTGVGVPQQAASDHFSNDRKRV